MRRIRIPGVLVVAALTSAVVMAQQTKLGYDDTPMQPDGKWRVHDGNRPQPAVVTPGPLAGVAAPPSDATVLLGPTGDMSAWQQVGGGPVGWTVEGGIAQTGKGTIETKASFADVQLHIEFATPTMVRGEGQGRGNSGVYLAGLFEIQILDSYNNPTYPDGQAAAMYGQFPPLVNASRPPGEWQAYDITFTAPRYEGATLTSPAVVTVLHNGVLVHNARPFWGPTAHRIVGKYVPVSVRGPVRLQDHSNPVRYRNIWIRELEAK